MSRVSCVAADKQPRAMTGPAIRPFWWPWALLAAAAALVLGGWLHPQEDEALHGLVRTGAWLGDPAWVPSRVLLLSAEILLIIGLYGLVTAHRTPSHRCWRGSAASTSSTSSTRWAC